MGDAQPLRPALPPMRKAGLSIDTSQAQNTQRAGLKLDIRDVVRREGYRADLNMRAQREEFRGNTREEQRMQRRDAFWNHVNKGVAYSWVSDRGLVVSDEEMELAFKFYRGGEGIGWLSEANVWSKLSSTINSPSHAEFKALDLFERDGISWEDLHKLLDDNELGDFDPVREAFALLDKTGSGVMSRDQIKQMAESWGIGDITEEDVNDLFRAAGVDPSTQPSITMSEYRDIVRIDMSKQEGVRVKLVDQLAEQPLVIIGQDPNISFGARPPPTARNRSPTAAGAVTARGIASPLQSSTNTPGTPTRNAPASPSRNAPAQPWPTSAPSTPMQFPGLRLTSPTRATAPTQLVFPLRPDSPTRPSSASARPSSASSRPSSASARPSTPVMRPASPSVRPESASVRPTSPTPRSASPALARSAARPASPATALSPSRAQQPLRPRSATLPTNLSSPPARAPSPSLQSSLKKSQHNVAFASGNESTDDEKSITSSSRSSSSNKLQTKSQVQRTGSTGSMKLNLALFKAEEVLKKSESKGAIPVTVTKSFELQKPKLKDMYSSNKEIDKMYTPKK